MFYYIRAQLFWSTVHEDELHIAHKRRDAFRISET